MATVYLAVAQGPAGFNKLQVIKRLRPALAADPEFLNMFLEEARLAARITHPNIIQTNEVGYDGQYYFIAMEYVDGQALESIGRKVADQGGIPLNIHLHILAEAWQGLHAAHELTAFDGSPLNVVHRDVSPHNVMVTYDGHAKVLDFGIAKAADSSTDTRTGIMKGKCAYMAPEQFGGKVVDRRADVFAMGIMLWQAITGKRLWKGLSDAEVFTRLAKGEIPKPLSIKPDIAPEIDAICMKALSTDREDRYATAADFQAAIEQFLSTQPRVTSREVGAWAEGELLARESAIRPIRAAIEAELSKPPMPTAASGTAEVPILWQLVPNSGNEAGRSIFRGDLRHRTRSAGSACPLRGGRSRGNRSRRLLGVAKVRVCAQVVQIGDAKLLGTRRTASAPSCSGCRLAHSRCRPAAPDEARIFVDDSPLAGNPATATFVRDGASHRLRVEAPGYVAKRDLLVFDTSNLSVDMALDREKPQAVAGRPAWTPPVRPNSAGVVLSRSSRRPNPRSSRRETRGEARGETVHHRQVRPLRWCAAVGAEQERPSEPEMSRKCPR